MKTLFLASIILLFMVGCAQVAPEIIKTDEEYHKAILDVAKVKIKYVSCDVGLVDGTGISSSVDFPIKDAGEARAIINNPGVSIALGEMKKIAKETINPETGKPYWDDIEYAYCKTLGLGYRAAALGTIDILKLIPSLAPYLAIFGAK